MSERLDQARRWLKAVAQHGAPESRHDARAIVDELDRLRAEELRLSKLAGKQASDIAILQVELERAELKQMAADMAEIHRESRGRGPVERETFEAALLKIERVGERKKEAEQRAEAAEARVRELEDWLKRGKEAIRGAATRKPNGPFAKSMRVLLDEIDNGTPPATPTTRRPSQDDPAPGAVR